MPSCQQWPALELPAFFFAPEKPCLGSVPVVSNACGRRISFTTRGTFACVVAAASASPFQACCGDKMALFGSNTIHRSVHAVFSSSTYHRAFSSMPPSSHYFTFTSTIF
eukprot:scpid56539/ scgid33749/ 